VRFVIRKQATKEKRPPSADIGLGPMGPSDIGVSHLCSGPFLVHSTYMTKKPLGGFPTVSYMWTRLFEF